VAAGDGSVARVPYSDAKTMPEVPADAWPCTEYYGQICAYIDVERRQPPYYPPAIPRIDSGKMVYRGTHRYGAAQCARLCVARY
jgi:hypothetical protein